MDYVTQEDLRSYYLKKVFKWSFVFFLIFILIKIRNQSVGVDKKVEQRPIYVRQSVKVRSNQDMESICSWLNKKNQGSEMTVSREMILNCRSK